MLIQYKFPSGYKIREDLRADGRSSAKDHIPARGIGANLCSYLNILSMDHLKTMIQWREFSHTLVLEYHDSRGEIPLDPLKGEDNPSFDFLLSERQYNRRYFGLVPGKALPAGSSFFVNNRKLTYNEWRNYERDSLLALETHVKVITPSLVEWYMDREFYDEFNSHYTGYSEDPESIVEYAECEIEFEREERIARDEKNRIRRLRRMEKRKL